MYDLPGAPYNMASTSWSKYCSCMTGLRNTVLGSYKIPPNIQSSDGAEAPHRMVALRTRLHLQSRDALYFPRDISIFPNNRWGGRERSVVTRRGRGKTLCARVACPT